MNFTQLDKHLCFGGEQLRYRHYAHSLNCEMFFSIYLPPHHKQQVCPVVYWLSGLTCTDENFTTKAGAQQYAAKLGLILVMPDTSPRGENVANDQAYDLGQGAGFYVNATQNPWAKHYHMFDYISVELPELINQQFNTAKKQAIMGHSMGGHGALMIALRHPQYFSSVSAFAPIVNPIAIPWGQKAFTHYLGDDKHLWQAYDSCSLLAESQATPMPILIDQGSADNFLEQQLQPEKLADIAKHKNWPLTLRIQDGYDHSYYFIASFIEDHLTFHARYLFT